jgi:hypothetical protein
MKNSADFVDKNRIRKWQSQRIQFGRRV